MNSRKFTVASAASCTRLSAWMVPSGSVLAVKRSEIEAVVTIRGSKRLRLATPLPPEKFRALAYRIRAMGLLATFAWPVSQKVLW